jgi:formylglycine-generating enzyme required for sulfatase activity
LSIFQHCKIILNRLFIEFSKKLMENLEMKKIFIILLTLSTFTSSFAQNRAPVVTDVQAQQRSGTKLVDITYDVSDADGDTLAITVQVSSDSGKTFSIIHTTLSGDTGSGIRSGTGKKIVWDAGVDYPNKYGTGFQIKIIADDGKGGGTIVNDGYGDYMLVPAGSFQMGDNFGDGYPDERPVHTVNLSAYYIGKYKVTNREYKIFIDDGGYANSAYWTAGNFGQYGSQPYYWTDSALRGGGIPGNEDFPVVGVNWYEAMAYCKWLSAKTGKTYRLPTEAEWEKAARGDDSKNASLGHQRKYPWGDSIDGSYANYYISGDPYNNGLTPVGYYNGTTQGSFSTHNNASPYGAYDMAGNVWEWCFDWYSSNYYGISPANNPQGPSTPSYIVCRGGSWKDYLNPGNLRSANRGDSSLSYSRNDDIGFRVARD